MVFEAENFERADRQAEPATIPTDWAQLVRLIERVGTVTIKRDDVSDGHVISVTTTNPWAYAQRNSLLEALKDCNTSLDEITHA